MGEGILVWIFIVPVALVYLITKKMLLSLVLGGALSFAILAVLVYGVEFINKLKDNIKNAKIANRKPDIPIKALLISIAILLCAIVVSVRLISNNISSGGGKGQYDYVTNSDGTRTWYDTTDDHIVRVN